jgi:ABC-type dipeptide/oligopeptide/nickel transport system ATPase component
MISAWPTEIAHRVVDMRRGAIVDQGPTLRVLNTPRHVNTQSLIAAVPHGIASVVEPPPAAPRRYQNLLDSSPGRDWTLPSRLPEPP